MKKYIVLLLLIAAGNLYAFGEMENSSQPPVNAEALAAEKVMKSLLEAYPQYIEKVEYKDGDWALFMQDKWYYYANSKMLLEEQRKEADKFRAQQFYDYTAELPPFVERSAEEAPWLARIRESRSRNTLPRSAFFEDLLQTRTRDEAMKSTDNIKFLGKQVRLHKLIHPIMARIEEIILAEAKKDPKVQAWIKSLDTPAAWSWRAIAESQFRSYHSFGVAIDLLPKSLGGKQTYWLWSADWRDDWWNTPYTERYHPPDAVVKAFEAYGFVWGGKWMLFDTMHFEFRPEVFLINGLPLEKIQ